MSPGGENIADDQPRTGEDTSIGVPSSVPKPDPLKIAGETADAADALLLENKPHEALTQYELAMATAGSLLKPYDLLTVRLRAGHAIAEYRLKGKTVAQQTADILRGAYTRLKRDLPAPRFMKEVQDVIILSLLDLNRLDEAERWNKDPDAEAARFNEP